MDPSGVPLLSTTLAECVVIGVLALLFATVWLRAREPGMPLLALGFLLAAVWYWRSDTLPNTGPDIDIPLLRAWSIVIGAAVVLVTAGVVQYLGFPRGALRALVVALWLPSGVLIAALALGVAVPHRVFHVGVLLSYVGAAVLAMAALPFVMQAAGVHPLHLKYLAGLGLAVFGIIVLVISLLRRQRALALEVARRAVAEAQLREANLRLEARVGERTRHLHELVAGLEAVNRGVSHDLRGPLGGMSQLARLAAEAMGRGDASMAQRALPAIAEQCEQSVRMVSAMLDLARVGEATPRREPVALEALVRSAFGEVMLSRPGEAAPALHCEGLPSVAADPDLLRTVFVNLLGNAVKFSRTAAAPRIEVSAEVTGADVTVCVRDNGPGFAADAAERLFEPFHREHASTSVEGHGLGLSIVRRAIEAMGGRVRAEPEPGGGARFGIRLPGAALRAPATPEALALAP